MVQRNTFPGGPQAFFADVAQTTFISKNSIYTLQTLLGDGVVVSKGFFVVYSHDQLLDAFFLLDL